MTLEGARPKLVASASTKTFACDDAEVQQGEVAKPGRRWVRAAWIVGLAAFAGVWAFGFWYDTHRPKPEPLDATSMRAANADCQAAISSLSAITRGPMLGAYTATKAGVAALSDCLRSETAPSGARVGCA